MNNDTKILPNITALRFFLALLVVMLHVPQFFHNRGIVTFNSLPVFNKGGEAVYMFFSLSGFLIIRQLFEEKELFGKIDLKKFYIRRILRIFPLYYLVVFIGLIYYNIVLPGLGMPFERNYDLVNGIILLLTFFPNILASYGPGGILEVLWSIGIEEQFYILIAPLFVIPVKYIKWLLLLFSFVFVFLYNDAKLPFLAEYRMLFFYFSFAGWCSVMRIKDYKYSGIVDILIFILVTVYFTTDIFKEHFTDLQYHIFSMVLFGTFLISFTKKSYSFFQHKTLVYLGKISYGIYMFHPIVIQLVGFIFIKFLVNYQLNDPTLIIMSFSMVIGITILIAHISYQYYEKIFLRMKQYHRRS